ncbi:hypothetical protein [Lactococcus petauri]|uniref:hypothetical protein n=1 Tax=Lactococcus petauri TaxID=1940789 RepID=UPI00254DB08B|nr:hypothetical protein [Lactococcus petauri]
MSKIYIEARFQMPVLDTDEFGYDKEEVEKVDWEEFAKDDFWNSCEDMGELENKYDITFHKVQPKLSIPKKIAEMLDQEIVADDITKFAMFHEGFERLWLSDDLTKYCVDYKNYALASVYLAGKALGVELVEVTDE